MSTPTATKAAMLDDAINSASTELGKYQAVRSEWLHQISTSPAEAIKHLREADAQIADLSADLRALVDARAIVEQDIQANIAKAARQAAHDDLAAVVRISASRVEIAADLDAALASALAQLQRYIDSGNSAHGFASRALYQLHQGDTVKLFDASIVHSPRALGRHPGTAAALGKFVAKCVGVMGHEAEKVIDVDRALGYSDGIRSFADLAQIDADQLAFDFAPSVNQSSAEPAPLPGTKAGGAA